jgi:O-acetyl-ADP-ribose deacetylase (regulator of RNase III)
MKIEYRKGDLFKTDVITIVHGCNAQGVMGSGIAKIIREQYPQAYDRYRNHYELNGKLQLGDIIVVPCNKPQTPDYKIIINAITQEFFGRDDIRYVSYDAVDDCMKKINTIFPSYGITEIAMPQIGAGLGNGSWEVISSIIENRLDNVKPIVYTL